MNGVISWEKLIHTSYKICFQRDPEVLKSMLQEVYMQNVYPLYKSDSFLPFNVGDLETEKVSFYEHFFCILIIDRLFKIF